MARSVDVPGFYEYAVNLRGGDVHLPLLIPH